MNKNKILLIGKTSFVSQHLFQNLKKKNFVKKISFNNFCKIAVSRISKYDTIINCSINNKYVNQSYSAKNDLDLKIVNKIKNLDLKYIFLSTRKVYKIGDNIKESGQINPRNNYAKNKLITEKKFQKF